MRLQAYINEDNILSEYIGLGELLRLDEMGNDTFEKLKSAGKKMGFRVKKSKSLVDYFRGAEKGTEDLLRYATLFMMTDVRDNESRKELVKDAKNVFKSINKKDVMGMLMQLDKVSIGLTAHIRHIIQSVFGIEIATINYWYEDIEYIKKELRYVRKVLDRMGGTEKEIKALDTFEKAMRGVLK